MILYFDPLYTMDQPSQPHYSIDVLHNPDLIALLQQHQGFRQFFDHLAHRASPDADATLLRFFFLFNVDQWIDAGAISLPDQFDPDESQWRSILYGSPDNTCWIISKSKSGKNYFYQYDYSSSTWIQINRTKLIDYLWNMLYDIYLNFMRYDPSVQDRDNYLTILDHYAHHIMQINRAYIGRVIQALMPMFLA